MNNIDEITIKLNPIVIDKINLLLRTCMYANPQALFDEMSKFWIITTRVKNEISTAENYEMNKKGTP